MRPSFFRGNLQKGAARGCLDPTYTLFRAYTGREALEVVKQEKIHLILLDIMMPEMDGPDSYGKDPGDLECPHYPPYRQK